MYNLAYVAEETFVSTFMQRTFGLAMYGYCLIGVTCLQCFDPNFVPNSKMKVCI